MKVVNFAACVFGTLSSDFVDANRQVAARLLEDLAPEPTPEPTPAPIKTTPAPTSCAGRPFTFSDGKCTNSPTGGSYATIDDCCTEKFGSYEQCVFTDICGIYTPQPSPDPTPEPTPEPTPQPTPEPTPQPTPEPTPQPTSEPVTPDPTPSPINAEVTTPAPFAIEIDPTPAPVVSTPEPSITLVTTPAPSEKPVSALHPHPLPTEEPTRAPSLSPDLQPVDPLPSASPVTTEPTAKPTAYPITCLRENAVCGPDRPCADGTCCSRYGVRHPLLIQCFIIF
jgi:hypothetical protein